MFYKGAPSLLNGGPLKTALFLGFVFLQFSTNAMASFFPWRDISNPDIMDPSFIKVLGALPLQGRAAGEKRFWSGDYWALRKGNINYRWNSNNQKGFRLDSPSKEMLLQMTRDELTALAPSEKFDILLGRYDYPLVAEVSKIANRRAADWEGICHGWAPASVNHDEPTPKDVVSVDGITIPFGSSDIKGLLSYYYAFGFQVENTHQLGLRCGKNDDDEDEYGWRSQKVDACDEDLNAGAFHLVITNMLGLKGLGFVGDLVRTEEVWNYPIYFFKSEVQKEGKPERKSAPGTVKTVRMKTELTFAIENDNFFQTIIGTKEQLVQTKKYEYDLDIDINGNIIGGKWKSYERPDFLWLKGRPAKYEGLFTRLNVLLND
jgi:hypothetical protein